VDAVQQQTVFVTCYVCRRKRRRRPWAGQDGYELLFFSEVRGDETAAGSPTAAGHWAPAAAVRVAGQIRAGERVSVADILGGQAAGVIMTSVCRSENDAAGIVTGLPGIVQAQAAKLLAPQAARADIPLPAASIGADVVAAQLLGPAFRPVTKAAHALEVIGVVVGLVTGMPGLAVFCLKCLVHDELHSVLGQAVGQLVALPDMALGDQPSPAEATTAKQADGAHAPAAGSPSRQGAAGQKALPPTSMSANLSKDSAILLTGPIRRDFATQEGQEAFEKAAALGNPRIALPLEATRPEGSGKAAGDHPAVVRRSLREL
jgi:hypothetical protein